MCFGCSKDPSHLDGSFEYPQHMFWMRNKENNFPICTHIWRPGANNKGSDQTLGMCSLVLYQGPSIIILYFSISGCSNVTQFHTETTATDS